MVGVVSGHIIANLCDVYRIVSTNRWTELYKIIHASQGQQAAEIVYSLDGVEVLKEKKSFKVKVTIIMRPNVDFLLSFIAFISQAIKF